jgi:phosphotransferase system HPr-like phosphotransfer protein
MLLTLALSKDTPVSISAEGEDEVKAVDELVALIETGFGEA